MTMLDAAERKLPGHVEETEFQVSSDFFAAEELKATVTKGHTSSRRWRGS